MTSIGSYCGSGGRARQPRGPALPAGPPANHRTRGAGELGTICKSDTKGN